MAAARRIGVFGGAFDPPHLAHRALLETALKELKLDTVHVVPTGDAWHKPRQLSAANHRLAMAQLAFGDVPKICIDNREIARAGPSYTIDTLRSLREELGGEVALCLIMGSDAFAELDGWHRWQELLDHCHMALVERPNVELAASLRPPLQALLRARYVEDRTLLAGSPAGRISIQRMTALDISATGIRNDLMNGRSPRYLLPDSVIAYIERHQLYTKPLK
jgi:nicotinate-nucleotide adenylyltransferase